MRLKNFFCLLLLTTLLIGCSDAETEAEAESDTNDPVEQIEEQDEETMEEEPAEEVEEVEDDSDIEAYRARDVEGMMTLEPGEYGGNNYDESLVKDAIAAFPSDLTADDYFTRLLALTVDDYREQYAQITNFDTSYENPKDAPQGSSSSEMNMPVGKDVNVAILLDASGSMNGEVEGKTKMEHAIGAIESFVSILPSDANISLQVYGNEGSSSNADKALSCASTEVVYELSPYNEEQFSSALNGVAPAGWTPLAASISETYNYLQANNAEGTENIVYIVSDGIETCDGNPVEEAETLNQSDFQAVINIIGFDVDDAGQNELKKIAEAGAGEFMTVSSQQEMEEFFNEQRRDLEKAWVAWSSENNSEYHRTERDKLSNVYDLKNEIYEIANLEMDKLLLLTEYMEEELNLDTNIILEMNRKIRKRNNDIRTYTRNKEQELIKEIRENAAESRESVREKSEEGMDDLDD